MPNMTRRIPTDHDRIALREGVRDLSWRYARLLSELRPGDPPRSPFDDTALDAEGQRAAVVAHLAALHDLKEMVEQLIELTVTVAGETGAAAPTLGDALGGVSGSAVRKRFRGAVGSRPGRPGADRASWTDTGRDVWSAEDDVVQPVPAADPIRAFFAEQSRLTGLPAAELEAESAQRYVANRDAEE
jgi:hypothetical protein